MCNVFKPERCHHCSACNRCVLNMDHHCPWINNCVGFWNRKYFMLLLIYVLLTTYYVALSMVYDFILAVKWEVDVFYYLTAKNDRTTFVNSLMIQLSFCVTCLIGTLMTFFLKFHIFLVSSNKTTIENLEKKTKEMRSIYDVGMFHNWY